MVLKKQRERMKEYVSEKLENSGIYIVKDISEDCLKLEPNPDGEVYLFLHSNPNGSRDFEHKLNRLIYNGNYVTNIFYKNGEDFFRQLTDREKFILRDRSMKNYSFNEISRMIKLREKEQKILHFSGDRRLVYYQPDNSEFGGRLEEGLVSFELKPIFASYSHRNRDDKGYDFIMANDGRKLDTRVISGNKNDLIGKIKPQYSSKIPRVFNLVGQTSKEIEEEVRRYNINQNFVDLFLEQTGTNLEDWGGDVEEYINPQ